LEVLVFISSQVAVAIKSKKAEEGIKILNAELENRVKERTNQIQDALEEIRYENDERKRTEVELNNAKEELAEALKTEKELSHLKTRFISMVSHEYRTPLTVILTSMEIIERYFMIHRNDDIMKFIYNIKTSIKSMTDLLENVLTVGRIESGVTSYTPAYFDLHNSIIAIIDEIKIFDKNRHEIIFTFSGDSGKIINDENIFRQILLNLLSNATKYSNFGKQIYVLLQISSDFITIEVIDHGIGIPPEFQKNIFSSFSRAENVGTIQGTGLGLSIIKRCVELLKGTIEFSSELYKGTKFTLIIPNQKAENI